MIKLQKSQSEIIQKVMDYDISTVTKNFSEKYKIYGSELSDIELELKKFLIISILYPNETIPMLSCHVDDLWHTFILHTHSYINFCEAIGGQYLHHEPCSGDGSFAKSSAFEFSKKYFEVFGNEPDKTIWELLSPSKSGFRCHQGCNEGPVPDIRLSHSQVA